MQPFASNRAMLDGMASITLAVKVSLSLSARSLATRRATFTRETTRKSLISPLSEVTVATVRSTGILTPALFWIASYFVAAFVALRDPRKFGLMSLCFVTLLSGVLVFGVMMETRILLEFVPLLTLGSLIASGAYRKPEQVGTQR